MADSKQNNSEKTGSVAGSACEGWSMSEEYEPGLVSVIIPTYNRAEYLIEAMESVLAQTYRPTEQSLRISQVSRKNVLCVETGEMIQASLVN